jgi:glycosyltransferase involved in cell wall biosynthesis
MDYPPNVDAVCWFGEEVWPLIIKDVPDAVFEIVGRNPIRAVRALESIEGVHVIGEVEDVYSFVQRFRVSVSPIRIARGLQNKVLEAMAAAKPVVLTSAAACGIHADDGTHYLLADEPRGFADRVVLFLNYEGRCSQVGQAARAYVAEHHCWDREMGKLDALARARERV